MRDGLCSGYEQWNVHVQLGEQRESPLTEKMMDHPLDEEGDEKICSC